MPPVNIAYYRQQDWSRFVQMVDDPKTLHHSWEEWRLSVIELRLSLEGNGLLVREVTVDLDDLNNFCQARKLKNNAASRAQFIRLK